MDAPVLEVKGVKKYFPVTSGLLGTKRIGWIKAVDGVSFSVPRQETIGIVGESGCGKTTTSSLILKLQEPTEGNILFQGRDIGKFTNTQLKDYRKSVQAVFQDPFGSLSPRMRVRDIIAEPLEVNTKLNRKEANERVGELLQMVGLEPTRARQFPHEFSGGQRQRIAIARALATDSRLVVLDEPVSALDVSIRAQIINLLISLQQKLGVSYLLVGHDLAMIDHMSHQIAVMYLGKIVEIGPSQELVSHHLHPYTQALFSAALPSHPDEKGGVIVLSGEVPSPFNPPSGCHFHPRCPRATAACSEAEPSMKELDKGHLVACHQI